MLPALHIRLVLLCFLYLSLISTESGSAQDSIKPVKTGTRDVNLVFEKVYLHFDRNCYKAGEDIWFKAYLADAGTNRFISSETCLHVELYNREAKRIAKEVIRLTNGTGYGDFSLDEDLPAGIYFVRAYTNWMRNFGELFFFTRTIEISNPYASEPRAKTVDNSEDHRIDLQFMPEGGSLIEDILSDVGFKAIDESGHSCEVKGFVFSSANDTITAFNSAHLGMGKFSFIPKPGLSYYAAGTTRNGRQFRVPLPLAKKKGYVLHITDVNDNYFKVVARTNLINLQNLSRKPVYLSCVTRNNPYIAQKISVDTTISTIFISKKNFPEGITCITLYDSNLLPECERLFYIHKKEGLHLALSSDRGEYEPEEKAGINIVLNDTDNNPVEADLSMSVAELNTKEEQKYYSNICSHFLLESDIKGKIEQPGYYFDPEQADRFSSLDLLLLPRAGAILSGNSCQIRLPTQIFQWKPALPFREGYGRT